jgi:nucleoid-associated protein YgaU
MRSVSPYEQFGEFTPMERARMRRHVFRAGETLWGLAHRYYNDWRLASLIAVENDIEDVRNIERGRVLLIPPQPLKQGLYESV